MSASGYAKGSPSYSNEERVHLQRLVEDAARFEEEFISSSDDLDELEREVARDHAKLRQNP